MLSCRRKPVVAGTSLEAAVAPVKLEETAKPFLLLHQRQVRYLSDEQLEEFGVDKVR